MTGVSWARLGFDRPLFGTAWDSMGKTGTSMEMTFRSLKPLGFSASVDETVHLFSK